MLFFQEVIFDYTYMNKTLKRLKKPVGQMISNTIWSTEAYEGMAHNLAKLCPFVSSQKSRSLEFLGLVRSKEIF